MKKKIIGSSFDSWLREEGIYEEVSAAAIKRVIARQIEVAMQEKGRGSDSRGIRLEPV